MENSLNNPFGFETARAYLLNKLGESEYKEIKVLKYEDLRYKLKSGKTKPKYPSERIFVVDKDGNRHKYLEWSGAKFKRFDERGIIPFYFVVEIPKTFEDMGITPIYIKDTNICEGGGWHSKGAIYEAGGIYFER